MFGVVENEHITGRCLSGDDALVLRHVSGPVDLAFVVDTNFDVDFSADRAEAPELGSFIVVVRRVELGLVIGKLNAGDYQVVLLVRCVCAQD
jgi:hypothetical protein